MLLVPCCFSSLLLLQAQIPKDASVIVACQKGLR
jgi:hypothetical protein